MSGAGRAGTWLRRALASIGATLLVLAVVEGCVRAAYLARNASVAVVPLPYVIGHSYGPTPPWVDGLRILEDDPELVWRGRPHVRQRYVDVFGAAHVREDRTRLLRQFWPRLPASLRDSHTWEVALNAEGFRDAEFAVKAPGTVRILCVGDSWTFGANVGQDESYPRRLAAVLERDFPAARVEVLNLGVLGYSSWQGLQLLRRRGLELEPDVVVIGFGMNDSSIAGYRDRDLTTPPPPSAAERAAGLLERVQMLALLRYAAKLLSWEPGSPSDSLRSAAQAVAGAAGGIDYEAMEAWTRVAPPDYEANVREMVSLARGTGAEPVLLYNELAEQSPYLEALRRVAAETRAPLVDGAAIVARARREIEERLRRERGLAPAGVEPGDAGDRVEVLFRATGGRHRVPERLYVVGTRPELGDTVPNRVALHDDGSHGDERAGDGVWSLAVRLAPGPVLYVYTNSGRSGHWEGLDVPAVRRFDVPGDVPGARLVRPLERFGEMLLQADSWHTDARGYALIAEAIGERLAGSATLAERLGPRSFGD